ncbi:MAG TPA: 2Fe-2S ferredoxin, partial [Gammaproteobacteria bacterium]|nr:2Fe-2S ferredoxin [Gammaproteobacteria bacterium]
RWSKLWGKTGADHLRVPEDYGSIAFDLATNWKLAVENYLDAYHLPTVHP